MESCLLKESLRPVVIEIEISKIVNVPTRVAVLKKGPDYMANFSPANRAEISARLLKQILLKSNCRLHGEGFSPGRNSAGLKNLARFTQKKSLM